MAGQTGGMPDLSALSNADKLELQQWAGAQTQKAAVQAQIHEMTARCFTQCITSRITSAQLDRSEEACLQNCVGRFLDIGNVTLRHLDKMRTSS